MRKMIKNVSTKEAKQAAFKDISKAERNYIRQEAKVLQSLKIFEYKPINQIL